MERLSRFIYKVTVSFSNPEARDLYSSDYPEEQKEVLIPLDNPYTEGACKAAMDRITGWEQNWESWNPQVHKIEYLGFAVFEYDDER